MTFDCCEYGDDKVYNEWGMEIYPDLCECICHCEEEL